MYRTVKLTTWIMWILVSIFYSYQYVVRVLPNIIMPELMERFHVDATMMGQFSGFYYIGYALAHIPLGIMLDRIGPRIIISLTIVGVAGGVLPLVYSSHWIYPSLGRLIIGVCSSAAILGCFKVIRLGFPEDKFSRILGVSVTIGLLGAIYGGKPVNYLLQIFGFDYVILLVAVFGIVLAIGTLIFIPNKKESIEGTTILQDIAAVLTNRKVLLVCILGGLMVGPLEGFADVWGSAFIQVVYKIDKATAASLPSLIFIGMCFGAPFLTYLADLSKCHYCFISVSAITMGTIFIAMLLFQLKVSQLAVMLAVTGIMCAYQIIVIYKASTYVESRLVGLTTACANMIIMAFGYLFHSVIGTMMDVFWSGDFNNGVKVYDKDAFIGSISIIPISLIIAACGFIFLTYIERSRLARKSTQLI